MSCRGLVDITGVLALHFVCGSATLTPCWQAWVGLGPGARIVRVGVKGSYGTKAQGDPFSLFYAGSDTPVLFVKENKGGHREWSGSRAADPASLYVLCSLT